jgi:subtilase-type serine protease
VKRTASFGSIRDSDKVSYGGNSTQVFGEAGYLIDTPYAAFEPFAGAAYVHLNTNNFSENGGITALSGRGDGTDPATTMLGLRASHEFVLGEATTVRVHGMTGWRHAFGDTTPTAALAFTGRSAFSIDGLPIAEDAALIEAGFEVALSKQASLDISYSGQFSSQAHDNAVKADLRVRF